LEQSLESINPNRRIMEEFKAEYRTRTQLFKYNTPSWRDHGEMCLASINKTYFGERDDAFYKRCQGISIATLGLARCLPREFFSIMHSSSFAPEYFYMSIHMGGRINSSDQQRNHGFFFLVGLTGLVLRMESMTQSQRRYFLCSLMRSCLVDKNSLGRKELILPLITMYGLDFELSDEEFTKLNMSKADFAQFQDELVLLQSQCDLTSTEREERINALVAYLKTRVPAEILPHLPILVNTDCHFKMICDIRQLLESEDDSDVQTGVELSKSLVSSCVLGTGFMISSHVPKKVAQTLFWLLTRVSQKFKNNDDPKWKFSTIINQNKGQNKGKIKDQDKNRVKRAYTRRSSKRKRQDQPEPQPQPVSEETTSVSKETTSVPKDVSEEATSVPEEATSVPTTESELSSESTLGEEPITKKIKTKESSTKESSTNESSTKESSTNESSTNESSTKESSTTRSSITEVDDSNVEDSDSDSDSDSESDDDDDESVETSKVSVTPREQFKNCLTYLENVFSGKVNATGNNMISHMCDIVFKGLRKEHAGISDPKKKAKKVVVDFILVAFKLGKKCKQAIDFATIENILTDDEKSIIPKLRQQLQKKNVDMNCFVTNLP